MAEFNAMDTAAFKGVWVFCEQREGQVQAISYQLLSEGRKLANDLGVELCGVVMGSEVNEDYLKALGGYGSVTVTEAQAKRFLNGGELFLERLKIKGEGIFRVYSPKGDFLGLGETEDEYLKVRRVFHD